VLLALCAAIQAQFDSSVCTKCQPATPGSCTAAICTASTDDCKPYSCPKFYVTLSSSAQATYDGCKDAEYANPSAYPIPADRKYLIPGQSGNIPANTKVIDSNGNFQFQINGGVCNSPMGTLGEAIGFGNPGVRKDGGGNTGTGMIYYFKAGVTHPPGTHLKTIGFYLKRVICLGTSCFTSKASACTMCNSNCEVSPAGNGQSNVAEWRHMTADARYALGTTCTSSTATCDNNAKEFVGHQIANW